MRKNIPHCLINSELSSLGNEFVWSLRFSTHCIYHTEFSHFSYLDYKYLNVNKKYLIKECDDKFNIEIFNNRIQFGNALTTQDYEILNKIEYSVYSSLFCELQNNLYVDNFIESNKEIENISLFCLSNFKNEVIIVGSLAEFNNCKIVLDHQDKEFISFYNDINSILTHNLQHKRNILFRISLTMVKGKLQVIYEDSFNKADIKLLRSAGINIPLAIIQNFYKRKLNTFKFVDSYYDKQNDEIKLNIKFDTVYFDLDETLTWLNEPMNQSICLLNTFHKKGFKLILITRHQKVISETLDKIHIDKNIFSEIIKVEKHQKKSEFINTEYKSLFIDNEFPERYDVKFNANVNSIDIDQIEFITNLGNMD